MPDQLTTNPEALRLFFTDDVFLVKEQPAVSQAQNIPAPAPEIMSELPATPIKVPATVIAVPTLQTEAPAESTAINPKPALQSFNYVGANERNILILVYDVVHPVSSIAGRQLLGMILKSIKLDRNDCALLNYASCEDADFTQLQTFFKPQYVFAFGVTPAQLGLPESPSNSIVKHAGTNLIFSSELLALSDDPAIKKLLWSSLKQIELI